MVASQDDSPLASLSLQQFVRSVGARTPAPGGGSVSAAIAAMVRRCVFNRKLRRLLTAAGRMCCGVGGGAGSHGGADDVREEAV